MITIINFKAKAFILLITIIKSITIIQKLVSLTTVPLIITKKINP